MTRQDINKLQAGDIVYRRADFRALAVADVSRLEAFEDVEAFELDVTDAGDLVRMDDKPVLITARELEQYEV